MYSDEQKKAAVTACLGKESGDRDSLLRIIALTLLQQPDSFYFLISLRRNRFKLFLAELIKDLDESTELIPDFRRQIKSINWTSLNKTEDEIVKARDYCEKQGSPGQLVGKTATHLHNFNSTLEKQLILSGEVHCASSTAIEKVQKFINKWETSLEFIENEIIDILGATFNRTLLKNVYTMHALEQIGMYLYGERKKLYNLSKEHLSSALHDVYLNTKTAEIVLSLIDLYPAPEEERDSGIGSPANSPTYPADIAEPAQVIGNFSGPFLVEPGDASFQIEINHNPTNINLPVSTQASVLSSKMEPYEIVHSTQASITGENMGPFTFGGGPPGHNFRIQLDGVVYGLAEVNYLLGDLATNEVIANLQANLTDEDGNTLPADVIFSNISGRVRLSCTTPGARLIIILSSETGDSNTVLGFSDGQSSEDGGTWEVAGITGNEFIIISVDEGAYQLTTLTEGTINATQVVNDMVAVVGAAIIDDGGQVRITSNTYGDGSRIRIVSGSALSTLGFSAQQYSQGTHIEPNLIATAINNEITGALATVLTTEKSSGNCETIPGNLNRLTLPAGETANIELGDVITLGGIENAGSHEIIDIWGDEIGLNRPLFFSENIADEPISAPYTVANSCIQLTSTLVDTLESHLNIPVPNILWPMGEVFGAVSGFDLPHLTDSVRVGDVLYYQAEERTINIVDKKRLEVSPLIPMNYPSAVYSIISSDGSSILGDGSSFTEFQENLRDWINNYQVTGRSEIQRLFNLARHNPSNSNLASLTVAFTQFRAVLIGLRDILATYKCRSIPEVQDIVDVLEQRGEDKALDELITLQFEGLFTNYEPKSYTEAGQVFLHALFSKHRQREAEGELDEFLLEDYHGEYEEPDEDEPLMSQEDDAV